MTTKAQALDHLTDVLAGEDVAGEPTVAGAIDKLATMIEDGEITIGGGGGDGGAYYINGTVSGGMLTVNASYNDIVSAIQSGKIACVKISKDLGEGGSETLYNYVVKSGISHDEGETFYDVYLFSGSGISAETPTENMSGVYE